MSDVAVFNGKTPIVLSVIALLLTIISGGWVIIQQSIDKASLPLKGQIDTLESVVYDLKRTQEDRNIRISTLEGELKSYRIATEVSLKEVETQFKASDQARNIQYAQELRLITLLWDKTFVGSKFPSELQYYPEISSK